MMEIISLWETICKESRDKKDYNESESEDRMEYNCLLIQPINLIAF